MIFHGFDTETDNNEGGGQAVLVTVAGPGRNGLGALRLPRTFSEIFDFLAVKGGRVYVAFNADFDVQAICHDNFISYKTLRTLARFKIARWRDYSFKYVPTKFFTCRKGRKSFTVYDLRQFFGCSLAEAARKHLGIEKLEIPRAWYRRIKSILKNNTWEASKIIAYAERDAEIAFELGKKLVESYTRAGVTPTKLISPASMSIDYFRGDLEREPKPPMYLNQLWQRGFYGGRVEIGSMGKVEGVSLYDIHSAYPAEIAKLVSLDGATMYEGKDNFKFESGIDYGLYHLTAYIPLTWHWGPLAVRDKGKVIYPVGAVKTWCCAPALRLLHRLKIPYKIHKWFEFSGSEGRPIFHDIEKLYLSRRDPILSLAAKLTLNSLYGKLCENTTERIPFGADSYRSRDVYGRFTNYILASHITESVRMKVFDLAHKFGSDACMMATDSIMLSSKSKIPTGPNLGEWDQKGVYKSAVILGCGRYYLEKDDGKIEGYLRGFRGDQHYWKLKVCSRKTAKITTLENLSMLQWSNGAAVGDLNVLNNMTRVIRLDDDKRFWLERPRRIRDAFEGMYRSQPWIVGNAKDLRGCDGSFQQN